MSILTRAATDIHTSAPRRPLRSGEKTPFAFVLSHSFSGSTLLSFLLGAHPEIATVGEMFIAPSYNLDGYPCSCGEPIERCAFWREVAREMEARGIPFDIQSGDTSLTAGPYGHLGNRVVWAEPRGPFLEAVRKTALAVLPGVRQELDRRLEVNRQLAEVVMDLRNAQVFVDATKRPGRALLLRRNPHLDLKIIHLVRDGRAVARSTIRNLGRTVEDGAQSWLGSLRHADELRRLFPEDHWMVLRHEDLCRDPRHALEGVFRFLGVSPDQSVGDFRASDHHIIGNRMRLSRTSEIRLDERWRTEMTSEQIRTVERIAGSELGRYGYVIG